MQLQLGMTIGVGFFIGWRFSAAGAAIDVVIYGRALSSKLQKNKSNSFIHKRNVFGKKTHILKFLTVESF